MPAGPTETTMITPTIPVIRTTDVPELATRRRREQRKLLCLIRRCYFVECQRRTDRDLEEASALRWILAQVGVDLGEVPTVLMAESDARVGHAEVVYRRRAPAESGAAE